MTARQLIEEIIDAGATAGHIARVLDVDPAMVCRWRRGEPPNRWRYSQLVGVHWLVAASVGVTHGEGVAPTENEIAA